MVRSCSALLIVASSLSALPAKAADETSSGDKLRMLYSNRIDFNDDGVPVVTVEIMSGQQTVQLGSSSGVVVLPDGESGAAIDAGDSWTVTIDEGVAATLREWIIVDRVLPENDDKVALALGVWKKRGFKPRTFEIGTIFAVSGSVIDSREVLIAVSPQAPGEGEGKARELGRKFHIDATVHVDITRLPRGTIVARSGKVEIKNPSVIWFTPKDRERTLEVKNVEAGGGGSSNKVWREDRRYFGSIYVTVGKDGKLVVANAVAADRLLEGIVPSEIFPSAPMAALEAQAVAARTELLEKIGTRYFGDPFLLCSSQQCQVYSGAGHENPRTSAAIRSTRGAIMTTKEGRLVDARFSAACGGFGENNESIWGGPANSHLRGHIDAPSSSAIAKRFAGGINDGNIEAFLAAPAQLFYGGATRYAANRFRWQTSLSTEQVSELVNKHYKVGTVASLVPQARGISGRMSKLFITGDQGSATAAGDLHIRRLLGGLRSTLFVVDKTSDGFKFRGGGFGHGVGLCQIGAIGMAEQNRSYKDILDHYYNQPELRRLY